MTLPDEQAIGSFVADLMLTRVGHVPQSTFGLATGSSPETAYRALATRAPRGAFAHAQFAALDEYVGLDETDPRRYVNVLDHEFLQPLGLAREVLRVPDGSAPDLDRAALDFEEHLVRVGGVDVQLLGIGHNGHIGFNEPGASPDSRTRVVQLEEMTRAANARFFESVGAVPHLAITQGLKTITSARQIVLIAQGSDKADILARSLLGEVSPAVPASILQNHPAVVIVTDEEAGRELTRSERRP